MYRMISTAAAALLALYAAAGPAAADDAANDSAICEFEFGDDVIASCNRAIERNPNDASAYGHRGSVYMTRGEHDRAMADYD